MSFCSECGIQLAPQARFCPGCGSPVAHAAVTPEVAPPTPAPERPKTAQQPPLSAQPAQPHYEASATSRTVDTAAVALEDPIAVFVGRRSAAYKDKWQKYESDENPRPGWNWAAFFFSGAWLAYRKMYAYAVIYLIYVFSTSIISISINIPLSLSYAIGLGLQICFALYADYIYRRRFVKACGEIEQSVDVEKYPATAVERLRKAGGTNGWAIVGFVIALAIVAKLPVLLDPVGAARWLHRAVPAVDQTSAASDQAPSTNNQAPSASDQAPAAADKPTPSPDETPTSASADTTDLDAMLPLAKQGNAVAQNNVGAIYLNGIGVAKDASKAVYWLKQAAAQREPNAELSLGILYMRGIGVEADPQQAAPLIRDAADQGNADAENDMGLMYQNGVGVDQDNDKAAEWYRKASDAGSQAAAENLQKLQSSAAQAQN